ncbi:flagellar motor switch protein FliN [Pararhizobium sp.]|uniref:flagellar motor switch protein FliN n=1 Tax=Pararhizobium sp. TaxID=1977563 RepID=UPI003D0AD4B2
MAPKKAPLEDQAIQSGGDAELDQAIDDLRGVLQSDATGTGLDNDFGIDFAAAPATGETSDFGSTFSAETDLGSFGGDFGASNSFADLTQASAAPAFDAGSFGGKAFGGDTFEDQPASEPGSGMTANLDLIMDIPIDVQIVLGTSRMQVSGLMNLTEGATIALDRRIGEPVEIVVNGRVIGRGEITVLDEDETRFGVKLIEIKGTSKV